MKPLSWYVIALLYVPVSICTEYKHDITCKPSTCELSTVLASLQNDTRIQLEAGQYVLDKNMVMSNYKNILIAGTADVLVKCSNDGVGITFIRSHGIKLQHLAITKCGAPHIGTSLYNITLVAVFHFVYCRNLTFYDVSVSNNSALAVNLYDVGGTITFESSQFSFNKRSNVGDGRWAGGGIYVQFSYCGSMFGNGCNQQDDKEHQNYIHNNTYVFRNCSFASNSAPGPPDLPGTKNTDFLPPQGTTHMSLGRGGGLSLYLRSNASYNKFLVDNCTFTDNTAVWGGGFFTEVVDSCSHNTVHIKDSTFTGNNATWAGGGMRFGLIQVFDDVKPYINGLFTDTMFVNNYAIWGGATSVYATEEALSSDGKATSKIRFVGVQWIQNYAANGAAVGGASWKILSAGGVVKPVFVNTTFKDNLIVDYKPSTTNYSATEDFFSSVVKGQGSICTNAMPLYFEGVHYFLDNIGTVFLMTDAVLTVAGAMEFHRNKGHDGGGIALLGQSWININPGSRFLFSQNKALRGAGIFVQTPGTPNRVASKNCFITYNAPTTLQTLVSPDKWKTFFNFSYNNASVAGHSMYCSTLRYCAWYMEVYGFHDKQLFNWTNFVYENESPLPGSEIATDPVQIALNHSDWQNMAPSDITNPTVKLIDERHQILPGIVSVDIQNTNLSNTQVDVSSGPFFPSDSNIYSFKLSGKSNRPFSLSIQTVTGRAIKAVLSNVTLQDCRPGYYLEDNSRCVCLKSPQTSAVNHGITRCQGDRQVFVRKGLWAGTLNGSSETFITLPCPSMYCDFRCPPGISCAPHEYLFVQDPHRQCQGHRTGILCGECQPGYSIVLGSDRCKVCPKGYAWVGYFTMFLIVGTLIVIGALLVNVDISTGHYTCCLFFYQVVLLLVRDGFTPDPVLNFLMGLANAQVGFGACMWYGMTGLHKLALTYVLPTYTLFLCTIVGLLSRRRGCVFSRRSALRAFTSLFLVSYTTYTSVSLELLHYSSFHGRKVLYKSGEVQYFKGEHIGFGVLAIIICIVIVFPFPLFLCLVQPLSYIKPGLGGGRMKPFLDIFQCCYQSKYRWFSGVYYLARILLLLIYTFISDSALKHSLLCFVCISLLTMQANIRPYTNQRTLNPLNSDEKQGTWINLLDSLLLMNLSFIALLGSFSTNSDSVFASILSSTGYSAADILCIFLMWLPAPYFIGIILCNLFKATKKKYQRVRALTLNHQQSVMSETSDLTSN